jgi:hypothetical protein
MQGLSKGDFMSRLRRAGVAGSVQASLVLEAFRLYIQSEFPDIEPSECEPLFVRSGVLVVKSTNPALMQTLRRQEDDIVTFIRQSTGSTIERLQFRAG